MDDHIVTQALLLFFGGLLLGITVGPLMGWWRGFTTGIGTGCLLIGLGGCAGAIWLGWHQYRLLEGTGTARGTLLEYRTQHSRDANNRGTTSYAPVVRYVVDGHSYEIMGLGGSDENARPGDPVPVRYRPERPGSAVIGDFQNTWGGTWGLSLFGVLPLMFGLFFVGGQFGGPDRPRNLSPESRERRGRVAQRLIIGGNLTFLGAFAVLAIPDLDELRSFGAGFTVIALACVIHYIGQWVSPDGRSEARAILLIIATGFAMFGVGAWLLAPP